MLILSDVSVGYDGRLLLEHVNLHVRSRDRISLVGPSGSGKTTLLAVLAGFVHPSSGEREAKKGIRIGWLAQSGPVFSARPVELDVAVGALARGESMRGARRSVASLLEQVGLSERQHELVGDLSGGERQRVCLARALAGRPDVLLLDEPTAQLDVRTADSIGEVLANIEASAALVVCTHDERLASRLGCRYSIIDGRLLRDA